MLFHPGFYRDLTYLRVPLIQVGIVSGTTTATPATIYLLWHMPNTPLADPEVQHTTDGLGIQVEMQGDIIQAYLLSLFYILLDILQYHSVEPAGSPCFLPA